MVKYLSTKYALYGILSKIKYVQYASTDGYLASGENTHALRLTSELVDLRAGYAKRIRRAMLVEPPL